VSFFLITRTSPEASSVRHGDARVFDLPREVPDLPVAHSSARLRQILLAPMQVRCSADSDSLRQQRRHPCSVRSWLPRDSRRPRGRSGRYSCVVNQKPTYWLLVLLGKGLSLATASTSVHCIPALRRLGIEGGVRPALERRPERQPLRKHRARHAQPEPAGHPTRKTTRHGRAPQPIEAKIHRGSGTQNSPAIHQRLAAHSSPAEVQVQLWISRKYPRWCDVPRRRVALTSFTGHLALFLAGAPLTRPPGSDTVSV